MCGDPYHGPLDNEYGGKYANGIIVGTYSPGEVIAVAVDITATHKGYMEFRLCPNDNPRAKITQECLDDYLLNIMDSKDTKYPVTKTGMYRLQVQLPSNVRCRNCVLQWKYNTGNSWGVDPGTGRGCIGCGNQEQFYGCADVAIGHDDIQKGLSLLTNQMKTGRPVVSPGVPTPPMIPIDDDDWGDIDNGDDTSSEDVTVADKQTDSSYMVYKSFLEFQSQFQNKHVRPCVCHTCVGSTCVCECFSSGAMETIGRDVIKMVALTIASIMMMNFDNVF